MTGDMSTRTVPLAAIVLVCACGAPAAPFPPSLGQTRSNVIASLEALSSGRYADYVLETFAPDATLEVHGPVEFAGSFTGQTAIVGGLDRVTAVVPVHLFNVERIWVDRGPDEVTAAAIWTDAARLASGEQLPSTGMSRITFGKLGIVREDIFLTPTRVMLDNR